MRERAKEREEMGRKREEGKRVDRIGIPLRFSAYYVVFKSVNCKVCFSFSWRNHALKDKCSNIHLHFRKKKEE